MLPYRIAAIGIILLHSLCCSSMILAQIPGSWERTAISRTWAPVSLIFSDSLHGVILGDSASELLTVRSFATSDGGRSWQQPTVYSSLGSPINMAYHPIASVGTDLFDFFGQWAYYPGERSFDGGITWTPDPGYPFSGNVIGCRMFDPSDGYIFVEGGQTVSMYETMDSGYTFTTEIGSGVPGFAQDVYVVDSSHIWLSVNGLNGYSHGGLLCSTDAGTTWIPRYPVDTSSYYMTYFAQIVASPDLNDFYVLGGGESLIGSKFQINTDFVKTTDGGKSWVSDSTLGGERISRMCAPAAGTLWAFLSSKISDGNSDLAKDPVIHGFSDTLCYSSDNGKTWTKDSKTFIGDTLTDMYWPDSTHGYITSWRDSTMYIYRFIPNSESVSKSRSSTALEAIRLLANPVGGELSYTTTGISGRVQVEVLDLLGRERISEEREISPISRTAATLNVESLPSGYYILAVTSSMGEKATQGFIKE